MKLTPPPKYYKLGSPQATLLLDVQAMGIIWSIPKILLIHKIG